MKRIFISFIAIFLLGIASIGAQTTEGTEFWVTFGQNFSLTPLGYDFQIRIVSSHASTEGTIYFTNLNESKTFSVGAHEVYTYTLTNDQKLAVYNITMGITDYSVHITSNKPVAVYVLCTTGFLGEATNILPVTALDTAYYQISYSPFAPIAYNDAYAVVATENNTNIYHNGTILPGMPIHAGQLYYRTLNSDMTGSYITANHPVAFFALNQFAAIPFDNNDARSGLMQQLAPVSTWGKNFFVPVSHITSDRVRIVASQNNTNIKTLTGGVMQTDVPGAQTTLTNLQKGEFVELKISETGCYIEANKSVGVCSYLTSEFLSISSPAQCWIPALEQKVSYTLIAPFIPNFPTSLNTHHALVCTPTATKDNTTVSVGDAPPTALTGGSWIENVAAQMSFYTMPLTNETAAYTFSNQKGLIILCYGGGFNASYYYLAGSAMRDLDAAFYANDVHFQDLEENPFCEHEVLFRAEIDGLHPDPESLKWFIDGVEEIPARDQLEWSKTFATGEYEITMWVRYETNETVSKTGILKIESCGTSTGFYANDVYYEDLPNTTICTKNVVNFRAEIEGINPNPGSLKWYIDGVEEIPAQDQLQWSKELPTGTYNIKMWVLFENNQDIIIESTLKVELFWVKIRNIQH
ncbi:MAG: IgGFc-binding protein [Bacteroidales bacterium]|nr:IgGFc-binding protein [Bacteroidales bacterium]